MSKQPWSSGPASPPLRALELTRPLRPSPFPSLRRRSLRDAPTRGQGALLEKHSGSLPRRPEHVQGRRPCNHQPDPGLGRLPAASRAAGAPMAGGRRQDCGAQPRAERAAVGRTAPKSPWLGEKSRKAGQVPVPGHLARTPRGARVTASRRTDATSLPRGHRLASMYTRDATE